MKGSRVAAACGEVDEQLDESKDRRIRELEDALRARDDFLAIVAHELRNPLTPVVLRLSAALRLAGTLPVPEPILTRLEQANDAVQHYVRRLDLLLELSRITSGTLSLTTTDAVRLADIAEHVAATLKPVATHAGSKIAVDVRSDISGYWDKVALEQVLQNLLSNAIKYGHGRPVSLSGLRRGNNAIIAVRDEGIGIPREHQQRIFQRFERVSRNAPQAGFGIGLWVVSQLVEAMGGSVGVQSELGQGATFIVTLPIASARERKSHD